jgi:hypothetical protein
MHTQCTREKISCHINAHIFMRRRLLYYILLDCVALYYVRFVSRFTSSIYILQQFCKSNYISLRLSYFLKDTLYFAYFPIPKQCLAVKYQQELRFQFLIKGVVHYQFELFLNSLLKKVTTNYNKPLYILPGTSTIFLFLFRILTSRRNQKIGHCYKLAFASFSSKLKVHAEIMLNLSL